jgi:SAM-dependent methyltransferase
VPDTASHWRDLHDRDDLSAVGQSSLPASMNRWLYRASRRQVRRLFDRMLLTPRRVYDVGAGTGYWTRYWRSLGAEVSGCDFAETAVARLQRFGRFEVLDISEQRPAGTYDLVWVANVLLHILDEDRFGQALANVASLVEANGYLIMIEPLQVADYLSLASDGHSRARPAHAYLEPLAAAGLDLVEMAPATAIASNPIEASSKLSYRAWMAAWQALKAPTRISSRVGAPMGAFAYALDPLALRLFGGVSWKLVVLQRHAQSHDSLRP